MRKLISLDVWNTLIWSNPEYKKERTEYLASELSLLPETIERAYIKIKGDCDKLAEQKSECPSNKDIYKKFLTLLGSDYNWLKLRHGLEQVFAKNPPHFLTDTVEFLNWIQDKDISLSIASNTNFIRGEILCKTILNHWGIDWRFRIFSDEINQPKPHPHFWKTVIEKAQKYTGALPEEILHIGDNKICDGSCKHSSINFHHISSPKDVPALHGVIA